MRLFHFIRNDEETLQIRVPQHLKGKHIQITLEECAPEDSQFLDPSDHDGLKQKEEALLLLDKLRNQIDVWDI